MAGYKIIFQQEIKTKALAEVLAVNLPAEQEIDFLSVDVEGLDFQVLRSNDWGQYRPKMVLVEVLGSSMHDVLDSDIATFMEAKGYTVYAKSINTVFFKNIL